MNPEDEKIANNNEEMIDETFCQYNGKFFDDETNADNKSIEEDEAKKEEDKDDSKSSIGERFF